MFIAALIGFAIGGALLGLIPFFIARYFRKPGLANLALLCCTLAGFFTFTGFAFAVPVCLGFIIAVFVTRRDFPWPWHTKDTPPAQGQPAQTGAGGGIAPLNVVCLSGPLRGQIYSLGRGGLLFGRDTSCAVRLPGNTPGVSRQHCCIRWQQGVPVLVDLNSSHGTFLGNGQKLPSQYPVEIAAGTRFYLGDTNCLFQVTVV